jgi:hypothetical protein
MKFLDRVGGWSTAVRSAIGVAAVTIFAWIWSQFGSGVDFWSQPWRVVEPMLGPVERFTWEHAVKWFQDILKALVGLVIFQLFCGVIYLRSYQLIKKSSFPSDQLSPLIRSTDAWGNFLKWPGLLVQVLLRFVQWVLFLSGLFSRPSIRRLLYVAFNPVLRRERDDYFRSRWSFLYVLDCLDFVVPRRVYQRAQIYIETELLTHPHPQEDDEEYTERVCNEYVRSVRELKRHRTPMRITCDSCFDIFAGQNQDKIEAYFQAQQAMTGLSRFLSPIEFQSGFLAPTYLVSGPLAEFDEDWTKIVDTYDDKLKGLLPDGNDPLKSLPDLRKLQSFIWDCWVQWGPSVPICSSEAWTSRKGAPQQEVALQFGYGDENNSLPICLRRIDAGADPNATESPHWKGQTFDGWEIELRRIRAEAPHARGVACPVRVNGHLRWLVPKDRSHRFCVAQHDTKLRTVDDADDADGWLVFEAATINGDPSGPLSYSAYIWVLIAICQSTPSNGEANTDRDGQPGYRLVHPSDAELWRGLIPFFQHGNIAEASVYNDIKNELAAKTVDSLLRELQKADLVRRGSPDIVRRGSPDPAETPDRRSPLANAPQERETFGPVPVRGQETSAQRDANPAGQWLHFAFVAASDDNGDFGKSRLVTNFPGDSIVKTMQRLLAERVALDPNLTELAQRIHLNPEAIPEITACHLPTIVQGYLDHIEQLSEQQKQNRPVVNPSAARATSVAVGCVESSERTD